ncbi:hypothetical protein EPJ64_12055 [Brachyspira aalborgi]|jgi:GTPase Era involved in 16S rRNA processing|uniref:Dynamin N-terminal domain-containing protein n=1 Tax=Brachyspira aalborgi TaxID=29522 RepID=A0AB38Q0T8_9SPIR|nr:dynamin family protein [Brachyspira aalborgi]MBS4762561.1 dynamin family protein [Brachyspira sp.]CCY75679.1 gTP-binding protein HSR1-related protein [Brachyspira sp. CAG:700]TXJ14750.1 hypothetical protein EPJ77_06170 [Brachyspira aalborgi]TXJ18615.1 hypothetical protein EPJ64_12055 [Brachyspira aalborgi]TXJ24582.1 hypothetical protein EPJ73_12220 [Brachyspira aalborgi]
MEIIKEKMNKVYKLAYKINEEQLIILSKFLNERIYNPDSFVVLLGETSSGKSSLLNGLMEENILYVSSAPSTGTIIEIIFKNDSNNNSYYAINKDATMEIIDFETFINLSKKQDENLNRLRLEVPAKNYNFNGLRLFDTPGYNSIVEEHDEILKEFLPNSDVIIYTVDYKIGIQEQDFIFLNFLKELLDDNINLVVVINRAPQGIINNTRINEIIKYAQDILNYTPKYFIVENINTEDYPMPKVDSLWKHIEYEIHSEGRKIRLEETLNDFIIELFYKCCSEINKRYQNLKLSIEQKEEIKKEIKEFEEKKEYAINLIDERFDKIINHSRKELIDIKSKLYNAVCSEIDSTAIAKKDETIEYINIHVLPFKVKEEISELQRYILIEVEDLNKELDDYINKEINKFNGKIQIIFSTFMEKSQIEAFKEAGKNILNQGLLQFFAKYGGDGKAGAGVANLASHLLKKVGNIFGKTFSKSTHNSLKHILAKIGATSTKAISSAVSVLVEAIAIAMEYASWKNKLKSKSKKAIEEWYKDANPSIIKDLNKLREENKNNFNEIFDDFINQYSYNAEIPNEKETMELLEESKKIAKEIGA